MRVRVRVVKYLTCNSIVGRLYCIYTCACEWEIFLQSVAFSLRARASKPKPWVCLSIRSVDFLTGSSQPVGVSLVLIARPRNAPSSAWEKKKAKQPYFLLSAILSHPH